MTTHIHTFAPGASITCEATADIIGGRLVELTGDRRVAHTQAGSAKTFGAAGTDAKTGADVLVLRGGVQRLVADAAIPYGTRIKPAAAGKVVAVANGETGIGLTITTTTAAGQLIHVALD